MTAMVLRTWLTNQCLQAAVIRAIRSEFSAECGVELGESGDLRPEECDMVTKVYSKLVSRYTLITKH